MVASKVSFGGLSVQCLLEYSGCGCVELHKGKKLPCKWWREGQGSQASFNVVPTTDLFEAAPSSPKLNNAHPAWGLFWGELARTTTAKVCCSKASS